MTPISGPELPGDPGWCDRPPNSRTVVNRPGFDEAPNSEKLEP